MSHKQPSKASPNGAQTAVRPDPEVIVRPRRRIFSAAYKLGILAEAERCTERGQLGALLRREGLYSSHLAHWRLQGETGELQALADKKRGRKPTRDPREAELARLEREKERLQKQLAQAELIIGAQKKLAQALQQTLGGGEDENS
jgi:hypothetical protein